MAEDRILNPHIPGTYSPLESLTMSALRRFGDFHPSSSDGDVMLMFLEFGNQTLDEVRNHPYWDGTELDYYRHPQDIREVNDNIIIQGLLMQYAIQQGSANVQIYAPAYYQILNKELWDLLNRKDTVNGGGGGNTAIKLRRVDESVLNTTRSGAKKTSPITGLDLKTTTTSSS